jgi:hypothetical protein
MNGFARNARPLIFLCAWTAALAGDPCREAWAAPELASWKLNLTGLTGYNGLPADVQRVRYSDGSVYVNASCIPEYGIGPWPGNPNVPTNQNFLIRIPRSPLANTGTLTSTPLGVIGLWTNGVAVFNALDARSYNNQNIWHQNAITVEGPSFDACLGHPAPGGVYHHHENASCLYGADSTHHSAILGYAFDGFPIYGPYAWSNADGSGATVRMRSSYALRNITVRHTLADGTALAPSQYGPDVSATYPLGYYVEDYEYLAGSGDLDASNGRFAVTPEYPDGIYAYYTTVDAAGIAVYPYHVGSRYHGVVATDNITSHGHVTIGEAVTDYVPTLDVRSGAWEAGDLALAQNRPNPATGRSTIGFTLAREAHVRLTLQDIGGRRVMRLVDEARPAGSHTITFDTRGLEPGIYYYRLSAGTLTAARHLLVIH